MITHFHIKNFKALRNVSLELTPIHVLIGPNDSGKSSILEAMAAVCRSVEMQLSQAFAGKWSGRELVWMENKNDLVEFKVCTNNDGDTQSYQLSLDFPLEGRSISTATELFQRALNEQPVLLNKTGGSWTAVGNAAHSQFTGAPSEQIVIAEIVFDLLSGVELYRWVPRFLALPNAPDSSRRFRMEPSGFGLASCLDDIMGYDRKLFEQLENRFKSIFPEVEIIRLLPEPAFLAPTDQTSEIPELRRADGKGIYFQFAESGPLIPASQVSDGMLLVLAYLTALNLPRPPRLLLVEEPENGIHPSRLQEVISILRDLIHSQAHTQIVLTTHSPYVVDLFQPNEVTLCVKGSDGAVQVQRLSESKAVREQVDVFTLGEIWTGGGDERLMEPATLDDGAGE